MKIIIEMIVLAAIAAGDCSEAQEKSDRPYSLNKEFQVAFLYGKAPIAPDGMGIPFKGDRSLILNLIKVKFGFRDYVHHYDFENVRLDRAVKFMNDFMPENSGWSLVVNEDAKDLRISGEMSKDLVSSLVSIMQSGNVYCQVTDGIVKFHRVNGVKQTAVSIDTEEGKITQTQKVYLEQKHKSETK